MIINLLTCLLCSERNRCDSALEATIGINVDHQSSPSELAVHSSAVQCQDNGEYRTQWSELANGTVSHSSDSHLEFSGVCVQACFPYCL
jgi:hypothetical protein